MSNPHRTSAEPRPPRPSSRAAQQLLLAAAGLFAIVHGLQNLTTRDDLTAILTLAFAFEVVAGVAAFASALAGALSRPRSGTATKR